MDQERNTLSNGTRVTYAIRARTGEPKRLCVRGTVVGEPIFDRYTTHVWVPVQPDGTSADVEPRLVRKDTIIEVLERS